MMAAFFSAVFNRARQGALIASSAAMDHTIRKKTQREKQKDRSTVFSSCCPKRTARIELLAERVGFEPTVRYNRTLDFESSAFDHSATSPATVVSFASSAAKHEIISE